MPDAATDDGLAVLADRVRAARLAAGLSIDDAAESAGMSPVTWGRVEKGQTVRGLTYAAIERVLHWKQGSVDAVLQGGEPQPIEETGTPRPPAGPVDAENMPADDTALSVLRVIATVLTSNLPDSMKLRLIAREIAAVEEALSGGAQGADAEERRATG